MTSLSTHVLDTAHGCPAGEVVVRLTGDGGETLFAGRTDSDGRCPGLPSVAPGRYRLTFEIADYFRRRSVILPDPPFLDVIPVLFGVAADDAHYHVPLLVSPYGYSTYRGS